MLVSAQGANLPFFFPRRICRIPCLLLAPLLIFACLLPASTFASGFLHASGVTTLDSRNQPIVLRGVNLGSWLWPEYYMMGNPVLSSRYGSAGTGTGRIANNYDGF